MVPQSTGRWTRLKSPEQERPQLLKQLQLLLVSLKYVTGPAEEAATVRHCCGCGAQRPPCAASEWGCSGFAACCVWSKTFPLGLCLQDNAHSRHMVVLVF